MTGGGAGRRLEDGPGNALGPGRSRRLTAAVATLWATMADDPADYGLLPELAVDAVLARADRGELIEAAPRLLELTVGHRLQPGDAAAAVERVGRAGLTGARRSAVTETVDAWWAETLMRPPGEHLAPYDPSTVLGVVVGLGSPMVRWLGPWLEQLDGPGAAHLAAVVLGGPDGLSGPAWVGKEDEARQVLGWARTETVVNGLTLIGGTHLDEGVLSAVLDRLIG